MTDKTTETKTENTRDIAELLSTIQALQTSVQKLETKNSDLIDREKQAKETATAAENIAAEKSGDIDTLKRNHQAALDAANQKIEALTKSYNDKAIASELSAALSEANVVPQLLKAATAMFKYEATVVDGVVMFDGKPLADQVKAFVNSDDGKAFKAAPQNSGAGTTGANGSQPTTYTKDNFDADAFFALHATNPEQAKAVAAQLGMNHLTG